jgi:hypothetical protein
MDMNCDMRPPFLQTMPYMLHITVTQKVPRQVTQHYKNTRVLYQGPTTALLTILLHDKALEIKSECAICSMHLVCYTVNADVFKFNL